MMTASFRSASSSASPGATTSFTCNKPSGVVAGDMLVLSHSQDVGFLSAMGPPSGGVSWTLLTSSFWPDGLTDGGVKLWWKIAGSSEPASYGLTQDADGTGTCSIICVQTPGTGVPIFAQANGDGSVNTNSIPTPSTTPNGADDFEIRIAYTQSAVGSVTFSPPAGLTERTDLFAGTQYAPQSAATRSLTSSATTGVRNFTASQTAFFVYLGYTINIGSAVAAPRYIGWGMRI